MWNERFYFVDDVCSTDRSVMKMTRCYWYHEYRDMNMTVPYCEELRTENPHCENECSCKYYISKDDADKLIRKAIESLSAEPYMGGELANRQSKASI